MAPARAPAPPSPVPDAATIDTPKGAAGRAKRPAAIRKPARKRNIAAPSAPSLSARGCSASCCAPALFLTDILTCLRS